MSRIFVYGSLRGPGVNHHYLLSSRFIAKAYAKGALYRINGFSYPALLEGEAWITGELYEVDAQTEKQLDELEGYTAEEHPDNLYHKRLTDIVDENLNPLGKAYVYVFNADAVRAKHLTYEPILENDYFPQ